MQPHHPLPGSHQKPSRLIPYDHEAEHLLTLKGTNAYTVAKRGPGDLNAQGSKAASSNSAASELVEAATSCLFHGCCLGTSIKLDPSKPPMKFLCGPWLLFYNIRLHWVYMLKGITGPLPRRIMDIPIPAVLRSSHSTVRLQGAAGKPSR